MKTLTGIPASPGIVIGKALLYREEGAPDVPRYAIRQEQVTAEWERLQAAFAEAIGEVEALHERARREMGKEQADIVAAHLMMLEDPDFQDQIKDRLETRLENVDWIVAELSRELAQKLSVSTEPYFKERAADISDVSRRLLRSLLSVKKKSLANLTEDVVLVAHDLLPSEVIGMNRERVKAIVMDVGSRTSHTAILAQAFAIPAVLGLSGATGLINDGDLLLVDGGAGDVILEPDEAALGRYREAITRYHKLADSLFASRDLTAETLDGHRVVLKANIELPEEAELAVRYGAEGIGLYRSEVLFLTPGQPAEEEAQYRAYSRVAGVMGKLPVTIRTIDVGGDKVNPEMRMEDPDTRNPLLGWRAIRFSLSQPEMFKTQLRALLRAGAQGKVRIMFPMISGIEELEQALALVEEAKAECRKRKQPFDENIEVGIMVEIPSAAMTADILAKKSAFFSIGTNDLVQYTLAVDRGNEKVSYLAQPLHPAVLRLLKTTIDAAHQQGIKAAMCGELAGDIKATALLIGLGLDEFSMTSSAIPLVKQVVRGVTQKTCQALAAAALACESCRDVEVLVKGWMKEQLLEQQE